ncbi:sel1 repeat family protein [Acinetobacter bohemicus]|uniref:tetratricopeptide repeat protein n=1 Tax=Acinetobacter TaxID=469 RepID=UPI00157D2ED1|nr:MULTISPECIES: tetratricopeptide repeat protein [Acinetobacter]MCO8043109.1 sel1 repeat family protein [Acinetobacter sp. S4400-12]MCU7225510.1 sel1 repeat family protein [Acinetobacter bohemicus]QKQ69204.1 sel1 repeat family protein [Acinetobacter sp. 10FS3-1]
MWFLLVLILGIAALAFWMWKRPDPVQRDQAKAVQHDLWIEQMDAQLKHAARLAADPDHPDHERAYQIYQSLAQQQEWPQAYVGMALMHLKAQGREQNSEKAISLFEKAFSLGSEEAAYHLGQMYDGHPQHVNDPEKALYWYRHAVARGHLDAQYRMSALTETDHGAAEQQRLQLLLQHARQGHANSQYQLAQHYLAEGAQQDLSLGMHYLFLAAQQDHLMANQQIADAYARGKILPQDHKQALYFIKRCIHLGDQSGLYDYYAGVLLGWIDTDQRQRVFQHLLQQSREHTDAQAKTLIGLAYFHGWYVDKNQTMAFRYWSEAAQSQHPQALNLIAALYFESYLVAHEPEKAFLLYQSAAAMKPDDNFNQMGQALCYLNGVGVAKDTAKATRMIQAVAQQEQLKAESEASLVYMVGRFYSQPEYPLPTREKAVQYLNQAVAQGSAEAAWFLYQAYAGLHPVFELHDELAKRYLHQAAQLGHVQAQAELGLMYLQGKMVEQDLATGLKYLQQAASQHNALALNALGEAMEQGVGVTPDLDQAMAYYRQAAAQVNADAYGHLGRLYTKGVGVERDIATAREWLEKASLLGHQSSSELLKHINAYLHVG